MEVEFMRRVLFYAAAAAALCAGGSALAAPNWSGPYVGLNAGDAWGTSNVKTTVPTSTNLYFASSSISSIDGNGSAGLSPSGFTGGAQIGFNQQNANIVWGIEADWDAMNLNKSTSASAVYPDFAPYAYTLKQGVKTSWLATIRPRVGVATGSSLFYVTAGVAMTDLHYNEAFTDNFPPSPPGAVENGSKSSTRTGWTAGVGDEFALSSKVSIKAEYLYADFGTQSSTGALTAGTGTATLAHSASLHANILRVGANWKF
jgi:outer membrane immunogenic protein